MKTNFRCPRCRKEVTVGKRLHAKYTCPNCHTQMVVSSEERDKGHVNYKHNFFSEFRKAN